MNKNRIEICSSQFISSGLLEETEDELAEQIKKGSVKVGEVSKVLCQDLSQHCKQTSSQYQSSNDEDDEAGEL
ncbi:hypothetical protein CTI12_AA598710 [Artemisia annua]|uniref:DUF3456 domain-containing protein n=1 Tax=Artemisia annua TaxID=35608 RepID=A0A2U1KIE6_ARTAN|nr:hypothetical protein CTI12_AA598710 [Artemisia annua]